MVCRRHCPGRLHEVNATAHFASSDRERVWPTRISARGKTQHMRCSHGPYVALSLLCIVLSGAWPVFAAEPAVTTVRFEPTDELLANPGQGWLSTQRLPCTVRYLRVEWKDLEPAEGKQDWSRLDSAIEAAAKRGQRIAFRIMTTNAHSAGYYCSPKWLFDLGCKSWDYDVGGADPTSGGKAIRRIEPDYADPLYLSKHAAFIKALGARYDGHAGVEFLDIGSYGIWGEWHTRHPSPWLVRRQIIDMYLDSFRKTPLMCMSDDAEALAYCIAHGTGIRRDGVGSDWHEKTWIGSKKYAGVEGFADNWKRAPVVFEWFGNYDYLVGRQWSFDSAVEFMLKNHVTFINDNIGKVPAEQWPKIEKLARLAGYRLELLEAAFPSACRPGQAIQIRMKWRNSGVGKMYRKHPLALYLLDERGVTALERQQPAIDPCAWLPGDHEVAAVVQLPHQLAKGRYTLALALLDPVSGKPAVLLACTAKHEGRVYRLGQFTVE